MTARSVWVRMDEKDSLAQHGSPSHCPGEGDHVVTRAWVEAEGLTAHDLPFRGMGMG